MSNSTNDLPNQENEGTFAATNDATDKHHGTHSNGAEIKDPNVRATNQSSVEESSENPNNLTHYPGENFHDGT